MFNQKFVPLAHTQKVLIVRILDFCPGSYNLYWKHPGNSFPFHTVISKWEFSTIYWLGLNYVS